MVRPDIQRVEPKVSSFAGAFLAPLAQTGKIRAQNGQKKRSEHGRLRTFLRKAQKIVLHHPACEGSLRSPSNPSCRHQSARLFVGHNLEGKCPKQIEQLRADIGTTPHVCSFITAGHIRSAGNSPAASRPNSLPAVLRQRGLPPTTLRHGSGRRVP